MVKLDHLPKGIGVLIKKNMNETPAKTRGKKKQARDVQPPRTIPFLRMFPNACKGLSIFLESPAWNIGNVPLVSYYNEAFEPVLFDIGPSFIT